MGGNSKKEIKANEIARKSCDRNATLNLEAYQMSLVDESHKLIKKRLADGDKAKSGKDWDFEDFETDDYTSLGYDVDAIMDIYDKCDENAEIDSNQYMQELISESRHMAENGSGIKYE